jgi:hypothetical protein
MGDFSTGDVLVKNNPFIFYIESEKRIETGKKQDYPNPLRAIFDDLAPLLFESEPSTRYPQEFSGVKGFDILTDPLSALMVTSAVPDPVIGLTTQRRYRPTVQGEMGLATHMNLLVDASGSMSASSMVYGHAKDGTPLGGVDVATIAAGLMVAQCEIAKDTFSVFDFATAGQEGAVWEGPSGDHKGFLDYIFADYTEETRPFAPRGGTNLDAGLKMVYESVESYDFDQTVTCVIIDATNIDWKSQISRYDDKLRGLGPLFYIIIGSSIGKLGKLLSDARQNLEDVLFDMYKTDMSQFALDFGILVGEDGDIKEFAGKLIEIASMNQKKKIGEDDKDNTMTLAEDD